MDAVTRHLLILRILRLRNRSAMVRPRGAVSVPVIDFSKQQKKTVARHFGRCHFSTPTTFSMVMSATARVSAASCHWQRWGGAGNRQRDAAADDSFNGGVCGCFAGLNPCSLAEFSPCRNLFFHAVLNRNCAGIRLAVIIIGGHHSLLAIIWPFRPLSIPLALAIIVASVKDIRREICWASATAAPVVFED